MRADNKRALYEKIMRNVSREVKRALNEDAIESNELDELDDASNDTIVIRKDMMNPGKTDYDYCKTIFTHIFMFLLKVPSTPFNFQKEIILDDTFKKVFNEVLNNSRFRKYKKDPTLISLGKHFADDADLKSIYGKYTTLTEILIIKKNIPDLLNQLKKHPKMKHIFQTRDYLPDYYFNDFSNCKFHPSNIDEFSALVNLYINVQCIGRELNWYNLCHLFNDIDLSIMGNKMETFIYNMGVSTKKIIGKLSKYNFVNILDVCEEFKNNYPELWDNILDDIKTNGKKCLFYMLNSLVLDEYRGENYKTVGSLWDNMYLLALYPDLFDGLLEIRDADLYKEVKFYMTECKKFPIINNRSDVNKLDPDDFILTCNKRGDDENYSIIFNVDLQEIFPNVTFKSNTNIMPVRVERLYNYDKEWEWDILIPSYDIYHIIVEKQFIYNDMDSIDAFRKINKTLRENQLEWVKQYLESNGVEGATISECIINSSNYKEYVLNDNDPLKMAYKVTEQWRFGM